MHSLRPNARSPVKRTASGETADKCAQWLVRARKRKCPLSEASSLEDREWWTGERSGQCGLVSTSHVTHASSAFVFASFWLSTARSLSPVPEYNPFYRILHFTLDGSVLSSKKCIIQDAATATAINDYNDVKTDGSVSNIVSKLRVYRLLNYLLLINYSFKFRSVLCITVIPLFSTTRLYFYLPCFMH